VAGAVVGDGGSFLLGSHFKDRISNIWPFTRHKKSLELGQAFFIKHGSLSVAFGRFFGPVRAIVPLIAGSMGMSPWRFALANILSALVWAPAYLAPGMVFGASLELASQVAFRLVIMIVLLAVLIWLAFWLARLIFRLSQRHASTWLQAILNWTRLHPTFTDIAAALADPRHPEAKGLTVLATMLLFATGFTVLLLGAILDGSPLAGIDHTTLNALMSLHTPWADQLMLFSTHLADGVVISVLFVVVSLFLAVQRHWRTLLYWLAAAGFTLMATVALKHGLQIPRPPNNVPGLGDYSFPSGHTLRAVVLFGFMAIIIARSMVERWRWLPYSLAGILITLVGISRLYLGVHWLSDVLGSVTLGTIWVAMLGIAYYHHTKAETHWLRLSVLSILILTGTVSIQTRIQHASDLQTYLPQPELTRMAMGNWQSGGWQQLPRMRQDTRAHNKHPLNIQYAGDLARLESELKAKGWSRAEATTWSDLLKFLSPDSPLNQLPLLPQVHDGAHESLTLIKTLPDSRCLVLRLWPSHIQLQPANAPLWLGGVTEIRKETIAGMLTFASTANTFEEPLQLLLNDSSGLYHHIPEKTTYPLLLWTK
jgi:undecaprenyl-diphosphatase